MMRAAHAQNVTPSEGAQVPVIGSAAIPPLTSGPAFFAAPASRTVATTPSLISLNVEDAQAKTILGMISEQGKVNIMIGGDVNETVGRVMLNDVTPGTAIQRVAMTAGLVYKKLDDNTYFIGKTLPAELAAPPQAPIIMPPTGFSPTGGITMNIPPNFSSLNLPPLSNTGGTSSEEGSRGAFKLMTMRNIAPRIMAWWLDPQNHDKPDEFLQSDMNARRFTNDRVGQSALSPDEESVTTTSTSVGSDLLGARRDNADSYGGLGQFSTPDAGAYTEGNAQRRGRGGRGGTRGGLGGGGGGGGGFDLPEGVDRIIAVEPQNALLVYGTTEGVNRLQEIVSILDQPLRQVEIEAQFVTVNSIEQRNFGIDFSGNNGTFNINRSGSSGGSTSIGFVRGNFRATLNALISNNRAKIVNSPRVTAINNLTASLLSTTRQPIVLNTINTNVNNGINQQTSQRLIYINTSIGLTVRPTINNDDTITIVLQPEVSTQRNVGNSVGAPLINTQSVKTVANVRDGDTIALGGLRVKAITRVKDRIPVLSRIPLIGQFFTNVTSMDDDSDLIIFVTARIIRRAEDPVAGTFVAPQ